MNLFLSIIYFLVPAAFANMAPVLIKNQLKIFDYPVDLGYKLNGKRIFGNNKTVRGFVAGISASIIAALLQSLFYKYEFFNKLSIINYNEINIFVFGFLVGFSVLFGDLIGSFIKRRMDIKPGKSLYFIDQINGGFGLAIFIIPLYLKSWILAIYILLIWTVGHFIIKYLGYILKIEKRKI